MMLDVIVIFLVSTLFLYGGLLAVEDCIKYGETLADKSFAVFAICGGTFGIGLAGLYLGRMFPLMLL